MSDSSSQFDDDIEAKYQALYDDSLDHVLVIDGVPIVDKSKREKLITRVCKEFSRKGIQVETDDMFMPWDDGADNSKGCMFVEFKNVDDANLALPAIHNHPFDARHTFKVNRFTDIERYSMMDEMYTEPELGEYRPKEHLRAWLADPLGRDQYATYCGDEVLIHWYGKPSQCEVAYKPEWRNFAWSPSGIYAATLHHQGVRLWGGPSWKPQQRFAHPLVKLIDFSPCENYLVTWSNDPVVIPEGAVRGPQYFSPDDEGNNIAVWDIKSGNLLRTFSAHREGESVPLNQQIQWPSLKWSPDDKFVARLTPAQMISVYKLPSMHLHGKKSIKIDGVVDFEWCPLGDRDEEDPSPANGKAAKPQENMLVYWTPEVADQPARVTLIEFPSRTILRQKNLFNVTECKLYWQNQGDFLCVKVDRHTKMKKKIFCNLEIFRLREKDVPVEVVEIKDTVLDFSWEPKGERFAIVSSSDPNLGNPGSSITDVSFYQLDHSKNDFRLLRTLPSRTSNAIRWSPRGRHVVLATVCSSAKSEIEFWDMDLHSDDTHRKESQIDWGAGVQLLGTADHYGVTDVEWDPSGRYLATTASALIHMIENGYVIWDFRGQEIMKRAQDGFKQFIWRPRPPTLLSKERQKEIKRNIREFSPAFDEEDAAEESNVSAELVALRKRLVDAWNAWRGLRKKELGLSGVD